MSPFRILKGPYLWIFILAMIWHGLLILFAPDGNGYVYDFYSDAIIWVYEKGEIPLAEDCWVCYHPPLLPILGAAIFHIFEGLGANREMQLFAVASFLNALSLVFSLYTFAIYQYYRKNKCLDLVLWVLILFLPVSFISSFSIESDMLASCFIVVSSYYFIQFLDRQNYANITFCAFFVGLAALSKYNGAIIAAYFGLILLVRFLLKRNLSQFRYGLTFASIVFLIGSYPYILNIQQTGSPIAGNNAWDTGKNYYQNYRFKEFSISHIVEVFNHDGLIKLKHYKAYNNEVLTSHYGQLWTDFSIFSRPHRHGQWERADIYKGKTMPIWLLWAILVAGLIPVACGLIGFFMLAVSREATLLLGMFILSLAIYIDWFLGHGWWMLKTKYLLYLLPLWLVSIGKTSELLPARYLILTITPAAVLSILYCFIFAVF